MYIPTLWLRRSGFNPQLVHVGFVVDKECTTTSSFENGLRLFYLVSIIPPLFHTFIHLSPRLYKLVEWQCCEITHVCRYICFSVVKIVWVVLKLCWREPRVLRYSGVPHAHLLDNEIIKVRCSPVQTSDVYRGSGGVAPFIYNLDIRWRLVAKFSSRLLYPRQRTPVPMNSKAGWAPELVWTYWGEQNLLPMPGVDYRTVQPAV
jgi:hypothetical protein